MTKLYAEKLARCITGLAFFGFGIALFLRANLGLAPWDIFHKGLSKKLDISIGLVIVGVVSQSDPSVSEEQVCSKGDMTLYANAQSPDISSFIAAQVPGVVVR